MVTRVMIAAALAAAVAVPNLAGADPQYSAKTIEKHFAKGLPKGLTRAICAGTDSECAKAGKVEKVGSFDMLITFEIGSFELSAQAKENLREWAKALNGEKLKGAKFSIDGHTDARGSNTFNDGLSVRRADAVVRFLESLGVSRDRLIPTGYGEKNPRNKDDPFAAINRRVEATLKLR